MSINKNDIDDGNIYYLKKGANNRMKIVVTVIMKTIRILVIVINIHRIINIIIIIIIIIIRIIIMIMIKIVIKIPIIVIQKIFFYS